MREYFKPNVIITVCTMSFHPRQEIVELFELNKSGKLT